MQRKLGLALCGLIFCSMVVGCSRPVKNDHVDMLKPIIMEKTGQTDRPEWVSKTTSYDSKGELYFSGGWMGGGDYAATLRLAKSEATKNLLESIRIRTKSEFAAALTGTNRETGDVGRYLSDVVAWTVDNLRIEGIRQNEIYYEKYFDPAAYQVKYNAWVQLSISKQDFMKAKLDAARRLYEKSIQEKDTEAKKKALQLLEKLQEG